MDKKRLEQFKKRLEERQQALRRTVSGTEQDGRAADIEAAQDIADKAASSYNKEFLFHQSNNQRQLLQMVEGALDRIRQGSFGQCISCGEDINPKRLEAVPWTRYCIECQEKLEKGQLEVARD
jgi:DnaK suppressor protein